MGGGQIMNVSLISFFLKVKYLLLNFKTRMEREKRMMECLTFTYSEAILNVEARGWLVSTAGA